MNRRSFFGKLLVALSATPILSSLKAEEACKATKAPAGVKTIDDKTAKRLEYGTVAESKGNKKYKAGSNCGNCNFYKYKQEKEGWAKCTMAANKYVQSCNWCKQWRENKKLKKS